MWKAPVHPEPSVGCQRLDHQRPTGSQTSSQKLKNTHASMHMRMFSNACEFKDPHMKTDTNYQTQMNMHAQKHTILRVNSFSSRLT